MFLPVEGFPVWKISLQKTPICLKDQNRKRNQSGSLGPEIWRQETPLLILDSSFCLGQKTEMLLVLLGFVLSRGQKYQKHFRTLVYALVSCFVFILAFIQQPGSYSGLGIRKVCLNSDQTLKWKYLDISSRQGSSPFQCLNPGNPYKSRMRIGNPSVGLTPATQDHFFCFTINLQ